jgi:hypothetical protein
MSVDGMETRAAKGKTAQELSSGFFPGSVQEVFVVRTLHVSPPVQQCQRPIPAYGGGEPPDKAYDLEELLRRAIEQCDEDARARAQQCLSGLVRDWLSSHPHREMALCQGDEEAYVVQAFEQFWQFTVQQQGTFRPLTGALVYLRASLNGAILDALRASSQPSQVPFPASEVPGEPGQEGQMGNSEVWEHIRAALPCERERRLAYLLYHCRLMPGEIVQFYPQEWNDVQEIFRLRRNIVERVLRVNPKLLWI